MKSVMLSIRPKWCSKIFQDQKNCEVRKTKPQMEPPFKCYIYVSKGKGRLIDILKDGDMNFGEIYHGKKVFITLPEDGWFEFDIQKVIGEFICDKIIEVSQETLAEQIKNGCLDGIKTGMRVDEFTKYVGDKKVYLWHITDKVRYCPAKPLSNFRSYRAEPGHCMKVPPQSWCYVEEVTT